MGLPCYFCTPSPCWTAVKDCVGCLWHMPFPSICSLRAEPVAKQVDSNKPSTNQVACLTPSWPWLGNDSPTSDIQIISKSLLQRWHTHPQLSVKTTTCQHVVDILKGPEEFITHYWLHFSMVTTHTALLTLSTARNISVTTFKEWRERVFFFFFYRKSQIKCGWVKNLTAKESVNIKYVQDQKKLY